MVFSTNQNRQLYVVNSYVDDTPASAGEVQLKTTADGKQIMFKYYGVAGLERTDLIDLDKITYVKITKAEDLALALKQATVTLDSDVNDGEPISGQDYVLRIYIYNYLAKGDDNVYIKYGTVHAYANMDASAFYVQLAISLAKNFSREVSPFFTFYVTDGTDETEVTATTKASDLTGTYVGVVIKEVEQPWILGTYQLEPVNFKVQPTTVTYEGDEVIWGTVGDDGSVELEESGDTVTDGKKIADLEYFCQGERGDQYRNIGWPNSIPVKYQVDPTLEYDVLDIHYSYKGAGVNNQASEKDLTFVADTSNNAVLTSLADATGFTDYGEVTSASE